MYTFTYDLKSYLEEGIKKEKIRELINTHRSIEWPRLQKNMDYYEGKHAILARERIKGNAPNQKPVCNHAKDIADTATGFFMGAPISYTLTDQEVELDALTDALDIAGADDVDSDNGLDMSRCGVAYEYLYVANNKTDMRLKNLEATNTFIVCDDTIEQNPLFGVYYYVITDSSSGKTKFKATVVTDTLVYNLTIYDIQGMQPMTEKPQDHFFGGIPIIEYRNGKDGIGDYEQQIGLIDAYNTLMADRVNDKQQFIDAILVIYGTILGDDEEETSKAMKVLKEDKLLELQEGAKAEYLTRTFDEAGVEVLRKAIKEDIYTFSHVPNLTDENFVGNSSGVAMEYKLIGLLKLISTKQKYYRKGLRKRFE
ncbi:MAG: phage portal protein, partial [Coprobacillus sp.]